MRSLLLALVSSFVFLSYTSPVRADGVSVDFTAISLGSGTWQYDYTLQGFFSASWGVAIYFPTPDYVGGSISDLGTGSSDWLTFAFQSDPTIPAPVSTISSRWLIILRWVRFRRHFPVEWNRDARNTGIRSVRLHQWPVSWRFYNARQYSLLCAGNG